MCRRIGRAVARARSPTSPDSITSRPRRGCARRSSATRSNAAELRALLRQAYAGFAHAAVAPLRQLDQRHWLLELFHGPTLAFKDVAMQALGLLFETFLSRADRASDDHRRDQRRYRLGRDRRARRARQPRYVHAPSRRAGSREVQRRQMTTVQSPNVLNIAVEGTFDDAQALVKAMFNDAAFAGALPTCGGQFDQLGAADVAGRLLFLRRRSARRTRAASQLSACRPATSATSSPAMSPPGWGCRSAG